MRHPHPHELSLFRPIQRFLLDLCLLLPTDPVPTYLVMSNIRFAYPFHDDIANWAMYLLRNPIRAASTVVAAIMRPKCSTPYSTYVSTSHVAAHLRKCPENQRLNVQLPENGFQRSHSAFGRAKVVLVLLMEVDQICFSDLPLKLLNCR